MESTSDVYLAYDEQPTAHLRWKEGRYSTWLEQKWTVRQGNKTTEEWREIPSGSWEEEK